MTGHVVILKYNNNCLDNYFSSELLSSHLRNEFKVYQRCLSFILSIWNVSWSKKLLSNEFRMKLLRETFYVCCFRVKLVFVIVSFIIKAQHFFPLRYAISLWLIKCLPIWYLLFEKEDHHNNFSGNRF